jgi:protein ImuB
MRTVGDVQKLPRHALGVRLEATHASEVMALLEGDDRAPLTPYVPPQVPEEKVELEYGTTSSEAIVFVAKRLSGKLAARLEGRGVGALRIELDLSLDRALLEEGDPPVAKIAITVPTPLSHEAELLAVLRARLESFMVKAPVLAATLRTPELAPRVAAPLDLFVPEARADRALPRLVAELIADLGEDRVGTFSLENRWLPDNRATVVPFGTPPPRDPRMGSLLAKSREPTRLLPQPKILASPPRVCITTRFEAVEWWRRGIQRQEYGEAWISTAGAMAWVEMDDAGAKVKGWLD